MHRRDTPFKYLCLMTMTITWQRLVVNHLILRLICLYPLCEMLANGTHMHARLSLLCYFIRQTIMFWLVDNRTTLPQPKTQYTRIAHIQFRKSKTFSIRFRCSAKLFQDSGNNPAPHSSIFLQILIYVWTESRQNVWNFDAASDVTIFWKYEKLSDSFQVHTYQ